jgi:hypothetical protein
MDVFYENLRKISEQKMTQFFLLLLLLNLQYAAKTNLDPTQKQLGNELYEKYTARARKGKTPFVITHLVSN